MSSLRSIFGLIPFTPKRTLVLPCDGGEITLYVVDGMMHVFKKPDGYERGALYFEGWGSVFGPGFANTDFTLSPDNVIDIDGELAYLDLEVVFRLVPRPNGGQTAEIVALSLDGCKTFYQNELCTLPREHEDPAAV